MRSTLARLIVGACATWLGIFVPAAALAEPIDFNRDIRGILSGHCFKCHGPDDQARQAGLRLDSAIGATAETDSGVRPIVPHKPDDSELLRRINSTDPDVVMPPPAANKPLSDAQKEQLARWISEGATYQPHWAFVPPAQAPLPPVVRTDWPVNPIDRFVLARLESAGLAPAPPADPYMLVRRVYLDLIGLPPTPAEADEFVNDSSPDAYERLVDRLLASPHYGERWARKWLDLARYADTNGYEKDRTRSIWPYRDWVIRAFNADMPFDQFTVEQLAGDILPSATIEQRIATGFHRNTMLNEEGGIDPLEFRFHAMVDRVSTTATAWLGLTMACAQCHTHKFDPIPHHDYYRFMAFLNNADEPTIDVPQPDTLSRQAQAADQIAAIVADLPNRFPPPPDVDWDAPQFVSAVSGAGATLDKQEDGSLLASGTDPADDTYTLIVETDQPGISLVRIEALTDDKLPSKGPGRTPHGNFVISEVTVTLADAATPDQTQQARFTKAEADFAQDGFAAANVIDGSDLTGWAIQGPDPWNVNRALTLHLESPPAIAGTARWTITLVQKHGEKHTLGRFRVSLGTPITDDRPLEVRRLEHRERRFAEWFAAESARHVDWTVRRPLAATSNLPLLTVQGDDSVFVTGDKSKRDVYELELGEGLAGTTSLRLEVLADDRLPKHGPGRIDYEGPFGDFFLSEVSILADGRKIPLSGASHTFADGKNTALTATDGDPHTGWSIDGGQGSNHVAVFNLAEPLPQAKSVRVVLLFERYYAPGVGRFRLATTTDARAAQARVVPAGLDALLARPLADQTPEDRQRLLAWFLSEAPEMAAQREAIAKLRKESPGHPTTLVLAERPPENPRRTFVHKRGEFLRPTEQVVAQVPSIFPQLPEGIPLDRLSFARWLVNGQNPLTGRVTMNRQWAAFFGRGIVRTAEDFGYQGASPSHPELLDWLAVELVNRGWSLKAMHRLIVTSATYRQSSSTDEIALAKDPTNVLLSRAPRMRLEAEQIRDVALRASGLLSTKIGGPSVFPPQPASVTSEGAYGGLEWKVSEGEDRYRRGTYTFAKRTAPYAMFTTFDGPSGEACVARREVSNTPLQMLTLLNDTVFVEAAQKLGRNLAGAAGTPEEKVTLLFRRCLTRAPAPEELARVVAFYTAQRVRLAAGHPEAASLGGPGDGDPADRAAWTALARALLCVDEAITKE